MSKRTSRIVDSIRQIADIQVAEWDFMELMNKDIRDLVISRSLRKIGGIQVMEWDFKTVMPAVNRFARQEVDVVGFVRRAASYKVMDWDFRTGQPMVDRAGPSPATGSHVRRPDPVIMKAVANRLGNFLQYTVAGLIDEPGHARISVVETEPNVLRFKLVMVKRDVAMLIGREGHTASAIRSVLRAVAEMNNIQVFLQIHSHEQEAELASGEESAP